MGDTPGKYSLTGLYLPESKVLTSRLQKISFIINDALFAVSSGILLLRVLDMLGSKIFLSQILTTYPLSAVLFIFSGVSLLFSAKKHIFDPKKGTMVVQPLWTIWTPILFAGIAAVLGFLSLTHIPSVSLLSKMYTTPFVGFCFFFTGLALIFPHTQIPHRFHITQALVFVVMVLNTIVILDNMYQLLSPYPMEHIIYVPLTTSYIFIFYCFGILCRWSNRGFSGNFTLDTLDSTLALRLILLNLVTAPIVGFVTLIIAQRTSYNIYEVVTLLVILLTVASFTFLWINVKLLYKYDLEHYLMREALRVHNIDLTFKKEQVEGEVSALEKEKQQVLEKLTYQDNFQNIAEKFD